MPPRPRAPRTRVSTIRRPRVAGLAPAVHRAEGTDPVVESGSTTDSDIRPFRARSEASGCPVTEVAESPIAKLSTSKSPSAGPTTAAQPPDPVDEPAAPAGLAAESAATSREERAAGPDAPRTGLLHRPAVPLLAVALVLLIGLAVFFGVADARLRGTPSASNAALVDVAATSEAAGQLTDALETVYSYDFARLDENERAARDVITPEFGQDFEKLFAQVRELAPQRKAVVSATVQLSAIQNIEGDRAVLVVFMDQRATTAAQGAPAQQLAASGRLTVTGERVDGRWKIAGVESR